MQRIMRKQLTVRIKNDLNKSSYSLNLNELRIIFCAITKIPTNDVLNTDIYYVNAEDLISLGANKKTVYSQIKNAADTLPNRYVVLPDDRTKFFWIKSIDYKTGEGRVGLQFSNELLPYIALIKNNFTKFQLEEIADLKSIYAIRVYSMLMQFRDKGTLFISVDELRKRLVLTDKLIKYADFKKRVIDAAIDQINQSLSTEIFVDLSEKKRGRKVDSLIFSFGEKNTVEME